MSESILREIAIAYIWKGHATCKIEKVEGDKIYLRCFGTSTVEHNGDEQGIWDQVRELFNQEFEDDSGKYRVTSSNAKIHKENQFEDSDHQITVTAQIILMKL